jgi:very-short-patch-repair endonuclease
MESTIDEPSVRAFWALARRQHFAVARRQVLLVGFSSRWIAHRIEKGRLHPVHKGVYAVGRPELTQLGRWMAAVLACGDHAALSHESAAALWGIRPPRERIDVSTPGKRAPHGIVVHERRSLDVRRRQNIPLTSVVQTLIDLAARLTRDKLEAAINEADKRRLTDPENLRRALGPMPRQPGLAILRDTLDIRTFTLTDSELERLFLPLAKAAGLPKPLTRQWVNGFRVDFYWPDLGLVVETDGLTYHRTPAQQQRDLVRDQAHTAAGMTPLRFSRAQVKFESGHVQATLRRTARRLHATTSG